MRTLQASLVSSIGKESACSAGDPDLIPVLGRSPREGNGNTLQYSCLENPMDRGACQTTVYRVRHDSATKPPPPTRCTVPHEHKLCPLICVTLTMFPLLIYTFLLQKISYYIIMLDLGIFLPHYRMSFLKVRIISPTCSTKNSKQYINIYY